MRKIYLFTTTVLMLFFVQIVDAQNMITRQIIVCSGGNFSDPEDFVTISAVSPEDGSTVIFDTIFTQSVQHIITHNGFAFVAAQDSIVKYNLDSFTRVAAIAAQGVNQLATDGELLLASFWYPVTENFVKTYSFDELLLNVQFSEISGDAAGFLIKDGVALVAIPGPWGSLTGKIASLDLTEYTILSEDDYGDFFSSIGFFANWNNVTTTFMKTDWGGTTFGAATMNDEGDIIEEFTTENASLANLSGQILNKCYLEVNNGIVEFDLETSEITNPAVVEPQVMSIGASVLDTINQLIYLTTTDFMAAGEGFIYKLTGENVGTFDAGISAQAIAVDYRETTGVFNEELVENLSIYPNPATNTIQFDIPKNIEIKSIVITNVSGQTVYQGKDEISVNVGDLNSGFYFTRIETPETVFIGKFIKK